MLLPRVVEVLSNEHISFVVIGASAMAAHGVSRSTIDIDLLTIDVRVLKPATWSSLISQGFDIDIRHGDAEDPLRGVVRFESPGQRPVDLIVGYGGWQALILERPESAIFEGLELPVVGKADLILLKLFAGGPQDLWDIRQLLDSGDSETLGLEVERTLQEAPPSLQTIWSKVAP